MLYCVHLKLYILCWFKPHGCEYSGDWNGIGIFDILFIYYYLLCFIHAQPQRNTKNRKKKAKHKTKIQNICIYVLHVCI